MNTSKNSPYLENRIGDQFGGLLNIKKKLEFEKSTLVLDHEIGNSKLIMHNSIVDIDIERETEMFDHMEGSNLDNDYDFNN